MSIYKLYGSGVTDNLASLDIAANGKIVGVAWAAYGDLDADTETLAAEVSFSSSSGLATNDTKSSISAVRAFNTSTATALIAINTFVGPGLNIPVKAGERLYLHAAGASFTGTAYVYVDDGGVAASARRTRL